MTANNSQKDVNSCSMKNANESQRLNKAKKAAKFVLNENKNETETERMNDAKQAVKFKRNENSKINATEING